MSEIDDADVQILMASIMSATEDDERMMHLHTIKLLVLTERERLAKIVDDYSEWTYWGEYRNAVAAEAAAREIAAAIRKGAPLTTDEISALDNAAKAT